MTFNIEEKDAAPCMNAACSAAEWLELIGSPEDYDFDKACDLVKTYRCDDITVELYIQNNGPGTTQRIMKAIPSGMEFPAPAVAVPFYYPEAMLGFDPETGEVLSRFSKISMMRDLARRGFIAATADAYYITYPHKRDLSDEYGNWLEVGDAIQKNQPKWTGIGKLLADTRLLIDSLAEDTRVDVDRIGIAGHSLGGKMAFYAGALDERIRAIMVNDFGFGWEQTNWDDPWYWGKKLERLKALNIDHSSLLGCAGGKPFCLIAGASDNMDSWEMMKKSSGYKTEDYGKKLKIINHGTGHHPPEEALNAGYDFLEEYLK